MINAGVAQDVCVVGIQQPQYFPYAGFFHKLARCDVMVLLDNVPFHKGSFQNRNLIKSPAGAQWLTIPVLHSYGQLIKDVVIDSRVPWQRKHWNAIRTNYSRSRGLRELENSLENALFQEWERLCAADVALIRWAMDVLGLGTRLVLASELGSTGRRTELLIDVCTRVGATTYLSGPGGRTYMDLDAFSAAGIAVQWQDYRSPRYEQLGREQEFLPDLSILDMLFCCGTRAAELLR